MYRQGYVDFLSQEDQWEAATEVFTHENGEATPMLGPPRTSLLKDLQYYLSGRGAQLAGCQDISDRALCFIHKLVAVHYLQLGLCSHTIVASLQWELSMKKNMCTDGVLDDAESQWCSVQAMERRLAEYCIDIHEIMLTLGIPLDLPDTSRCGNLDTWMNVVIDFQFLRIHFQNLRHRAEQLNSATTGLTGIAGNRQAQHEQKIALREAQRTKALTLVGLIFIPLAYTATLFSMEEQYMPGAKDFWIYFAVAAPLILVVILGYLALDEAFEKLIWLKSQKPPAIHTKANHEERKVKDPELGG